MTISPRYLVLANLVLLAAIAYVSSSAVGTAIAARLTPLPPVTISPPPPPLQRDARKPDSYYALIHQRDIFNSVKPEPEKPKGPPPKTELKVKLWGVAIHDDGHSSCVIEDLGNHQQQLYKIGDTVQGIATVVRVEWDKVILSRDGQEEVLELSPDLRKPSNMVVPVSASTAVDPHIQLVGDNQYRIDRSEVDSALENMNQLFTQIRAVPHFEGGKSTGFRLFAIRQDSLFDKIGLKNGDIIQDINGTELTDPSRALALFTELRNESNLTVKVLRNKELKTLSYQVQ
ncbi:MAG TPA: type II secretion system protein GspC [Candidatus Kryptonia bacterium]|nr:type II secretion system protein GspC [Candidatus Kryptonia bacterium]